MVYSVGQAYPVAGVAHWVELLIEGDGKLLGCTGHVKLAVARVNALCKERDNIIFFSVLW